MPIERLLATHEQLLKRIRRLEPDFVPARAVAARHEPTRAVTPNGHDIDPAPSPIAPTFPARTPESQPVASWVPNFEGSPIAPPLDGDALQADLSDAPFHGGSFETTSSNSFEGNVRVFAEEAPVTQGSDETARDFPESGSIFEPDSVASESGSAIIQMTENPIELDAVGPSDAVPAAEIAQTELNCEFEPDTDTFESRIAPRKASKTPALAVFETAPSGTPCTIIDMSATGARLRFPPRGSGYTDPSNIPSRFWLQIKLDRMQVECEVVRVTGEEMGVRFVSVPQPLSRAKQAPRKDETARTSAVRASITKRR